MRKRARGNLLIACACFSTLLFPVPTSPGSDRHVAGDPIPLGVGGAAGSSAPCSNDLFCATHDLAAMQGFIADGEWVNTPSLAPVGFITTTNTVVTLDDACTVLGETAITGPGFPGAVTRAFAWGIQGGDFWVGSWFVSGGPIPELYHVGSNFAVIASYVFIDSGTGMEMQISGLAMDTDRGHLWAILRNNPAGTLSRFVEFDIQVDPPVILQSPIDVPWPGGPSAVSSAGLDYNSQDCTLVALRQDSNNLGQTSIVVFQDLNPGGVGGVALLGECSIANTPCTGAGQGANRPWGIAVIEATPIPYAYYSDLNLLPDMNCSLIEQPPDFHLIGLPPFTGQCIAPVTPSTWGAIKARYRR